MSSVSLEQAVLEKFAKFWYSGDLFLYSTFFFTSPPPFSLKMIALWLFPPGLYKYSPPSSSNVFSSRHYL